MELTRQDAIAGMFVRYSDSNRKNDATVETRPMRRPADDQGTDLCTVFGHVMSCKGELALFDPSHCSAEQKQHHTSWRGITQGHDLDG